MPDWDLDALADAARARGFKWADGRRERHPVLQGAFLRPGGYEAARDLRAYGVAGRGTIQ